MEEDVIRKLQSDNEKIFEIEESCLVKHKFLKEFLEDFPKKEDLIPIKEVNDKTLGRIVEFLKHYKNIDPKPIPCPIPTFPIELKPILDDWDYKFITSIELIEAIDLVNAANVLNIQPLIDLASARIAYEFTNCSIEEARKKFGIQSDMTQEEQEEMNKYLKYLD